MKGKVKIAFYDSHGLHKVGEIVDVTEGLKSFVEIIAEKAKEPEKEEEPKEEEPKKKAKKKG